MSRKKNIHGKYATVKTLHSKCRCWKDDSGRNKYQYVLLNYKSIIGKESNQKNVAHAIKNTHKSHAVNVTVNFQCR